MISFKNLDKPDRDRIEAFNAIQFNLLQFNHYLKSCDHMLQVCDAFDKFLNLLPDYETKSSKNPENCMEHN